MALTGADPHPSQQHAVSNLQYNQNPVVDVLMLNVCFRWSGNVWTTTEKIGATFTNLSFCLNIS